MLALDQDRQHIYALQDVDVCVGERREKDLASKDVRTKQNVIEKSTFLQIANVSSKASPCGFPSRMPPRLLLTCTKASTLMTKELSCHLFGMCCAETRILTHDDSLFRGQRALRLASGTTTSASTSAPNAETRT